MDPNDANLVNLSAAKIPLPLERSVNPDNAAAPAPNENLPELNGGLFGPGLPAEKWQHVMEGTWLSIKRKVYSERMFFCNCVSVRCDDVIFDCKIDCP